ncbi:hypothetical protein ACSSV4_002503 [Roseovarius sp. MBR-154]|jgi:hypothetical protein
MAQRVTNLERSDIWNIAAFAISSGFVLRLRLKIPDEGFGVGVCGRIHCRDGQHSVDQKPIREIAYDVPPGRPSL